MKCEHIIELLSPYIDHMTNSKENILIDAHLAECPECRRELEYLKLLTATLANMEQPQIPEHFREDFHKCLIEEKTVFFAPREYKRPKRSGWIAAGLAGVALTIGIYISSILPIGSFIATFEGEDDERERPKLAIEEIIRSITGKNIENNRPAPEVNLAEKDISGNEVHNGIEGDELNQESPEQKDNIEGERPPILPRFTEEYVTKAKVPDMDQAINKVIQIAEANKVEHKLLPNTTNIQAMSTTNSKEVNLKVDKKKAPAIIKQLEGVGKVSAPVQSEIEITKEYSDIEEQIFVTDKLIEDLENQDKLNEAKTKELEELKLHLQENQSKKKQLDEKINTVTIKIVIEEEVKP